MRTVERAACGVRKFKIQAGGLLDLAFRKAGGLLHPAFHAVGIRL